MSSSRLGVLVLALLLLTTTLLSGYEGTHQCLLAQGYPPAYADGFDDNCDSGRQAAGSISGEFRKDVSRYLHEAVYAGDWGNGFERCRSMAWGEKRRRFEERQWDNRDNDWRRDRDRALARTLRERWSTLRQPSATPILVHLIHVKPGNAPLASPHRTGCNA